jgi:hypothetical protein
MSEADLLSLARSTTEHEMTWFIQMISINFAIVVGIYYFLNRATMPLKIFSFFIYSVGMLVLLGQIVVESNTKAGAIEALRSLPSAQLSRPTLQYLAVNDHWLSSLITITFNLAVWLLWISVFYLLFISRLEQKSHDPVL